MDRSTNDEDGRVPRYRHQRNSPDGNLFQLLCCGGYRRGANFHTDGYDASLDVAPKRNQQFASHRDDGDASGAPGHGPNPLTKPLSHLASRLVAKPEPRKLDHRCSGTWISGSTNATIPVDIAALVRHWSDTDVAGELATIAERAVENLACKDGRKVAADTLDTAKSNDLAVDWLLRRDLAGQVSFGLDLADQFQSKHKLPAKAVQFRLQVLRYSSSISGSHGVKISLPCTK